MTTPALTPANVREMIVVVDGKLKVVKGRHLFDQGEIVDILLDVRNLLEVLTSTSALVYLAKASHDETTAESRRLYGER